MLTEVRYGIMRIKNPQFLKDRDFLNEVMILRRWNLTADYVHSTMNKYSIQKHLFTEIWCKKISLNILIRMRTSGQTPLKWLVLKFLFHLLKWCLFMQKAASSAQLSSDGNSPERTNDTESNALCFCSSIFWGHFAL